ncbi:hypothetical protein IJG44_00950 [bacterium]|nr:hypothetical protein [bacterium]
MPLHLKAFLVILGLIFLVSCSSSKPENDTNVIPDTDTDSQDSEVVDEESDSQDSDSQDSDFIEDSDEKADADSDSDSDECQPPLSEATFPYYDKDGKITFCRPNCDTPTADDPICIGNLWDEQNDALCHEYPEYACCGTPCILESLKPMTKEEVDEMYTTNIAMHKCDLKINPWSWGYDGSHGVVKSWNMSDGKIGFQLYPAKLNYEPWPVANKYVTYDIATQKYSFIIPSRHQEEAYCKGKRLALISDKRSYDLNNENIFLAYIGDDGKTEIVYDKKVKSISYEPALNEKWAFVNLVDANGKRMMYAKVGEWKWTSLGDGLGWEPEIVGNRLALYRDDFKGYICDLDKYPKSLDECFNINDGEKVRYVVLDKEDSNRAVYSANQGKIILMEYKNEKWNYSDLINSFSDEITGKVNVLGFIINMFRGNMLLYEEAFTTGEQGVVPANKLCYYNLKSKKSYCMKKMENDSEYNDIPVYPYGDAEFEGKWLLYQKLNSDPFILRDMECYCKEENICPFEE